MNFYNTNGNQIWQGGGLGWGTPPTKSHSLLTIWSREKWKTLNLHFCNTYDHQTFATLWWLGMWKFYPPWGLSIPPTKSRGLLILPKKLPVISTTWSRGRLKTLYLYFHNTFDHRTSQSGELGWKDPIHLVAWSFGSQVTWQIKTYPGIEIIENFLTWHKFTNLLKSVSWP